MAEQELKVVIKAEDKASKELQKINGAFSGMEGNFSKVGGVMKGVALATVGAVTAMTGSAVAFGVSSVKAYAQAEASQARFAQAMRQVGKASDEQIEKLREQQKALQQKTRFEDDAIASGQAFLATFQMNSDQIAHLTPRLLDMAEGMRDVNGATIGLEQASNMLGKAIQLGTVGMLAKAGVTIPGTTKAMQDLWKKNFELANIQERVAMVGELVDGNFKGQAESAGKTLAGSIEILKNNFGELQETIGGAIATALIPLSSAMANAFNSEQFQAYALAFGTFLSESLVRGVELFGQFLGFINQVWTIISTILAPVMEQFTATMIESWQRIMTALEPIRPELEMFAKYLGVIIVGAIVVLITTIAKIIEVVATVVSYIIKAFSTAVQVLRGLFEGFFSLLMGNNASAVESFKKAWGALKGFFADIFSSIYSTALSKLQPVIDLVNKVIGKINDVTGTKIKEIKVDKQRAVGGSVMAGQSYVVGERGQEIFTPDRNGTITKTGATPEGAGGQTIVNNWNFSGAFIGNKEDFIRTIEDRLNRKQELYKLGMV